MVFTDNVCLWPGCKANFYTTEDLILHVEEDHVRDESLMQGLEQFLEEDAIPLTVHLSYVSPFFTETQLAEKRQNHENLAAHEHRRKESESSDSQTLPDDFLLDLDSNGIFTPESIPSPTMDMNPISSFGQFVETTEDMKNKPYVCPMPGCGKRYKNPNGIKYHAVHGHTDQALLKKPYKCKVVGCGKRYTNVSGLKHHFTQCHAKAPE
eukprot:Ihof_evm5s130 gene=Ihof_evmTU5s130